MADLKTEAASLDRAASRMSHVPCELHGPLGDFRSASHDLSAFGALGSLLKATGEIREGMTQLTSVVQALHDEWQDEAEGLGDVGKVLDEVDRLLEKSAGKG